MDGEARLARRIARRDHKSTPTGVTTTSGYELPPDLLQKAAQRVGWVALCYSLTYLSIYVMNYVAQPESMLRAECVTRYIAHTVIAVVLGCAVCALSWSSRLPARLMLDIGLVFEVAAALLISLSENVVRWSPDDPVRGQSAVTAWLAVFVLVVPATLGKTILAALATAMMGPVGLAFNIVSLGIPPPAANQWFLLFFPTFMIAGWAVLLSRCVYNLSAQVSKAREMGSYELTAPLGKGGMGEVWSARHRMLARSAAIKLIRPEALCCESEEMSSAMRRFEREARATAALHSPHTVAVYDYGISQDGVFYYVMELLDGLDLESFIERFGPQPPARVVSILLQACDSLAEAHASGLTHRDIKPRNMFLCRLGLNFDFVKVLDFGLVKFEVGRAQSQLTAEGVTTGTPAYMAPEIAMAQGAVDARADIYALGCVGYWLLTGQLVFDASSPVAMAIAHVQTAPIPPSQRTELEIPDSLERVILTCLEKDPARRPQSARELASLLAACELGRPWTQENAEMWWQTHMPAPNAESVLEPVSDTQLTRS